MNRYSIVFSPAPGKRLGLTRAKRIWWHGLPAELRSTKWAAMLCGLTIVALLMGFHQVVQSAVAQGALFRMNAATHAQAEWRCHALQGQRLRESCVNQLNSPPNELADTTPAGLAAVQVAQR